MLRRLEPEDTPESPVAVLAADSASPLPSRVGPFVAGTLVGGVAGAVLGTALSPYTRGIFVGLYHLINRKLSSSERDQLRFELLLQ